MMPRRPRLIASFLASVALMAAVARPLLACDAARAASAPAHANAHAHAHAHGHHAAHEVSSDTERPDPHAPHAPACDHVIGCAVVAIAAGTSVFVRQEQGAAAPS